MAMLDILNSVPEAPQSEFTQAQPPQDEADLEARKEGWRGFLTRLQTDPMMQTAAMETAKQLAQGPGYQQSNWSHLVQALQGGQQSLALQQKNQAEAQAKAEKEGLAAEVQRAALARQAEEAARQGELQPLRKQELEASIEEKKKKALSQPEIDKLSKQLTLEQIRNAKVAASTAGRNPEEERLQARFNLLKKGSKGQGKSDAELWDMVHEEQKDTNAGVGMQRITAMLNSSDRTLVDAAIAELKGQTGGGQPPIPPGYASVEAAKAAGLIYLNNQWLKPKAK